jgi:hypothetical protein
VREREGERVRERESERVREREGERVGAGGCVAVYGPRLRPRPGGKED